MRALSTQLLNLNLADLNPANNPNNNQFELLQQQFFCLQRDLGTSGDNFAGVSSDSGCDC